MLGEDHSLEAGVLAYLSTRRPRQLRTARGIKSCTGISLDELRPLLERLESHGLIVREEVDGKVPAYDRSGLTPPLTSNQPPATPPPPQTDPRAPAPAPPASSPAAGTPSPHRSHR
jgi:arginase family enzyme